MENESALKPLAPLCCAPVRVYICPCLLRGWNTPRRAGAGICAPQPDNVRVEAVILPKFELVTGNSAGLLCSASSQLFTIHGDSRALVHTRLIKKLQFVSSSCHWQSVTVRATSHSYALNDRPGKGPKLITIYCRGTMNFSPTEYSMDFSKFRSTRIAYSRLYFRPYSGFAMRKSAGINWFSKHSPSKRNNLSSPCKASVIYDYEIMQMLYSRPYIRLKARRNPGTDSCIAVDSYQGNGNAFRRGGPKMRWVGRSLRLPRELGRF